MPEGYLFEEIERLRKAVAFGKICGRTYLFRIRFTITWIFARAPTRNVQSMVTLCRTCVIKSAAITRSLLSPIAITADSFAASAS